MKYRTLGNSDLDISVIGLGSWVTYGGIVERDRAVSCVRRALDLGINFIDTANVYGGGAAESFLGETLAGVERSSYVLATKLYFPMSPSDRGLSAEQVHKQIDGSLTRLRTDYVDLYQCHRYDKETPLEETMEALSDLVRQEKVRYLGFSEWTKPQIEAAMNMPGVERFVSSQPQYSILWRAPEAEVIPSCAGHGIGQVVWSPLAQGVLTGKYQPGQAPPADSRRADPQVSMWLDRFFRDDVLEAVQQLRPIADSIGLSMAQLALAWVLREPNVSSAIIGATRAEQVEENALAADSVLDEELVQAIDDIVLPVLSSTR